MDATRLFCATLMGLWLTGCATYRGIPREPMNLHHVTTTLESQLEADFEKLEQKGTTEITPDERNDYINKTVTIIDVHYSQFVNGLGTEKRTKDMVVDFAELSLNLAGAAVGGAGTKTVLAAISAGVTGTDSAFDKNYFYDTALSSLIAQMNADRTEVYSRIVWGMQQETEGDEAYLWSQAVRDLIDYYNAGTLQHAAFSIKKEAGAKQEEAEEEIKLLMVRQAATTTDVKDRGQLTDSLNNISAANVERVRGILVLLSQALSDLPDCKALETKENAPVPEIKLALGRCIRGTRGSSRPFKEDHATIAKQFKEAGILAE